MRGFAGLGRCTTRPLLAVVAAVALLAASACGGPSRTVAGGASTSRPASATPAASDPAAPARIPVVAAENFYGDVLSQICGSHCSVTSILSDPNADPHEYETSARDAAAVADAALVVENGEGYDTFVDRLLAASPEPGRQVIDVQRLIGAPDGANPHLWYDPATMPQVARAIAAALGRIDPAHAAEYSAAASRFSASLLPLQAEIATIRQDFPGAPVAYTEPVFAYMGSALGLKVLTPEAFQKAVEDGNDPAAADLAAEESLLTHRAVKVLVYNLQTVTPVTADIERLAHQDGVATVGVTETEPAGQTYQQWMLDELRQVQTALGTACDSAPACRTPTAGGG